MGERDQIVLEPETSSSSISSSSSAFGGRSVRRSSLEMAAFQQGNKKAKWVSMAKKKEEIEVWMIIHILIQIETICETKTVVKNKQCFVKVILVQAMLVMLVMLVTEVLPAIPAIPATEVLAIVEVKKKTNEMELKVLVVLRQVAAPAVVVALMD